MDSNTNDSHCSLEGVQGARSDRAGTHLERSWMTKRLFRVHQHTSQSESGSTPPGYSPQGHTLDSHKIPSRIESPIGSVVDAHGRTEAPGLTNATLNADALDLTPLQINEHIDQRSRVRTSALTTTINPTTINKARSSSPSKSFEDQIRAHLLDSQGHNKVRRYLSGSVTITHTQTGTVELVAGDRFTLDMIERRLGAPLRIAAQFVLGTTTPQIVYRVDSTRHTNTPSNNDSAQAAGRNAGSSSADQSSTTHPLASRIPHSRITGSSSASPHTRFPTCPTLEEFIVGSSNRLALESIKQTIQSPSVCPPVFLHGSCGVGKTHLLRGATHHARKLHPGCKVRYTTGESFTNAFVNAIRTRSIDAFQRKYRGLDLLCIDDIHLMAGKQATQHELLQIFNTLSLGGAKIILASDAHPREIQRLDQALASRFSAGLVVKVEEPDTELARRLVAHIATRRGVFLDAPAIQTIVERVGIGRGASVRELEGAVVQIQAVARLMDRSSDSAYQPSAAGSISPTMNHVRKALSLRNGSDEQVNSGPIALDTIISRICQEMTVCKSDLLGKGRQKKVVMARELIVHTARNLTSRSFPEIAHAIGRPNHSTVITAAKRFKDRLSAQELISVGCPHDGIPATELAQMMSNHVSSSSSIHPSR